MIYFNPGCALNLYKPEMEQRLLTFLETQYDKVSLHSICCHYDPKVPKGSKIINVCAGCDRRFRSFYEGVSTISLWEVVDAADSFPFPNYQGLTLSIQDPCPVRKRPDVHRAVRSLLKKMNIQLLEPAEHSEKSVCCGDSFYHKLSAEEVHEKRVARANAMPCDEVCVYCVSCINSMHVAGKKPRHLVDLLMGESTKPREYDTARWHELLKEYRASHAG